MEVQWSAVGCSGDEVQVKQSAMGKQWGNLEVQ